MRSLEIVDVTKNYGEFRAIKGVSFEVDPGEFIVMVGPSGCGKSTLLRSIAGLEEISGGRILINGRDVTREQPSERGVAMVFQNYALYPHMSVRENMGFALKIAGATRAEVKAAVERAARILRIEDHLDKKPKQLSGGQKQRVAIGRAITRSPEVFLFDEPLSNLDAALRSQMRVELGRLHAELSATMVYVTHDQTEAMTMASRIVVFNAGRIEQVGAPLELYNRPANRFVAGFIGSPRMNFIRARVLALDGEYATLTIAGMEESLRLTAPGVSVGDEVTLGIRPEGLGEAAATGSRIRGTVAVIESLGRETLVYVDAGVLRSFDSESQDGYLAVHRSRQIDVKQGDPVTLTLDPETLFVFAPDGTTVRFPER
ncbi:ABC transporter ATP-binding protein [Aureimonas sp. AU12]|uniref:ABC transporter ATP-binding protein n=1 Tax=Aureimonas sp. AU12 TaxID=1638161 RepID=UPI000785AAB6|nr:ABC transporter ATP-binding protein [Aureimonas sp. AU12]